MSLSGARGGRRVRWSIVLLVALAIVLDAPILWTALAASGIATDAGRFPPPLSVAPTLDHLAEVGVEAPSFWIQLATSALVATLSAALALVVGFLAGYALARSGGRDHHRLRQGFLILATVPVMAYVLPLGELMRRAGLSDSIAGLALAQAAVTAPLAIYVLSSFLVQLPVDCEEAAWLDGASPLRVITRVVFPMSAETLASVLVVLFALNWNQLLIPLVVAGASVKTVPVAMVDFFTFERELDWPTAAAALVASLVPLLLIVALFHRSLDRFDLWERAAA
jgi:multiple sugar transport system permease protein